MSNVEKIENDIRMLSPEELAIFRQWFLEYEAGAWDSQIQEDILSGKLDSLSEAALESHHRGHTKEL